MGLYNITIEKGTTYELTVLWKTGITNQFPDGLPIDNTNYLATLQVRSDPLSPTSWFQADSNINHFIILQGSSGYLNINIPYNITAGFVFEQGVYDLLMKAPDTTVSRILNGRFIIKPIVTQIS